MRRYAAFFAVIAFLGAPAWAHVGSPDVYFQGAAGPYHLIITVRTPQMIPGIADVEILSATPGISKITVVPTVHRGAGREIPSDRRRVDPIEGRSPIFFRQSVADGVRLVANPRAGGWCARRG